MPSPNYYTISCFAQFKLCDSRIAFMCKVKLKLSELDITVKPILRLGKVRNSRYKTLKFAQWVQSLPEYPRKFGYFIVTSHTGFERNTILYKTLNIVFLEDNIISRNEIENGLGANHTIIGFNEFAAEIVYRNSQLL